MCVLIQAWVSFCETRENASRLLSGVVERSSEPKLASRDWNLGRPIVNRIDREADSIGHYREWDADDHIVLIRADDRRVLHEGRQMKRKQPFTAPVLLAGLWSLLSMLDTLER
ncbi:MAG: hypothetical protein ACKV2Q_12550 [Planctomycetaceae bacterium]